MNKNLQKYLSQKLPEPFFLELESIINHNPKIAELLNKKYERLFKIIDEGLKFLPPASGELGSKEMLYDIMDKHPWTEEISKIYSKAKPGDILVDIGSTPDFHRSSMYYHDKGLLNENIKVFGYDHQERPDEHKLPNGFQYEKTLINGDFCENVLGSLLKKNVAPMMLYLGGILDYLDPLVIREIFETVFESGKKPQNLYVRLMATTQPHYLEFVTDEKSQEHSLKVSQRLKDGKENFIESLPPINLDDFSKSIKSHNSDDEIFKALTLSHNLNPHLKEFPKYYATTVQPDFLMQYLKSHGYSLKIETRYDEGRPSAFEILARR